ncbi:MAG: hypothetical protein U9P49_07255 [Thermodesulfobacteriota bacterium]|nr:hypothetical protein [Thermodesulfobacteriota bacterium]
MRPYHIVIKTFVCLSIVFITGCASLQNYARKADPARNYIAKGAYEKAITSFPEEARGANEVLIHLERGTILQGMGQFEASAKEFESAVAKVKGFESRAVISASKSTTQMGSLLINEQVQPYEGEDFEKILIHSLDAINYLMMDDLEGARVEIRNAYRRQKELYEKHYKAIRKAEEKAKGAGWRHSFIKADAGRLKNLEDKAASVHSVYQNAFAYYISSLVYELNNEQDEAYIDLKHAIKAAPDSIPIQKDLIRLSKELHYYDDLELWEKRFGTSGIDPKDGIDVVVVIGVGLAPVKEEVKFPIPIIRHGRKGIVFAALPVYRFEPTTTLAGMVGYGNTCIKTSRVLDVDATAARNLLDEFPILFAKQIARTSLKATATNRMGKEFGALGSLAGSVYSAVTEQADLRTWSTLPKQIQVVRLSIPKQTRELTIRTIPTGFTQRVGIPDNAQHVIVFGRATDSSLVIHTKIF